MTHSAAGSTILPTRPYGEVVVWLILAATGAVSILLSLTRFGPFAAFAYLSLPLSLGLFANRYDRTGGEEEEEEEA